MGSAVSSTQLPGGLSKESTSTAISSSPQGGELPKESTSTATCSSAPATVPADSKPKKKICCACPETKKVRDECIVEHGESTCEKWIEAHRQCLRAEGFNV
ncbi:cytochrome c oxidase copper chaperone 1 [Lycium ferocissimum]|uniref:cytochrome c oxidase copper chaperone 1 n=1 Tax=Lycium ferocissimum TaxID=112874 RepID=UPI0028150472|nr:cytochrome c oxidase copper chaperone 1 [Lycium ferocissimum]XP_059284591.1 cytochrome c oxidase copper chaperone 1 [Lycium ferocissimum]